MGIPRIVTTQLVGYSVLVVAVSSPAQSPPPPETLTNISSCALQGSDVFITTAHGSEARRYRYAWTGAIDALCNALGFAMPSPDRAGRTTASPPSTAIAPAANRTAGGATSEVSQSARSQDASELNGRWVANVRALDGSTREVRITLENGTGTFKLLVKNREDPCLGLEFPVSILEVTADGFEMMVRASRALAGCPDFRWKPRRAVAGGYEGITPIGAKYVLVRAQ
jgi:hypothetical protein